MIAVEADVLRRLAPDLVITQDLCEVCAVADGAVHRLAAALDPPPRVLSLTGRTVDGVHGRHPRRGARARPRRRGRRADRRAPEPAHDGSAAGHRPRRAGVLCVEWLAPLYLAGHWVPDLVAAAGGYDVGAAPGAHSAVSSWEAAAALRPDLIVVMLCGFGVARAQGELDALRDPAADRLLRPRPCGCSTGTPTPPARGRGSSTARSGCRRRCAERPGRAWCGGGRPGEPHGRPGRRRSGAGRPAAGAEFLELDLLAARG